MFNPVWVTAYDRDELFATGDYPNQAADGAGLPAFAAQARGLTDTGVVLWFTFGTTTSPVRRTGRLRRSTRSASNCSRPASSWATRRVTTPSQSATTAITVNSTDPSARESAPHTPVGLGPVFAFA
jgi:Copper amine oxidase, enzyme domain